MVTVRAAPGVELPAVAVKIARLDWTFQLAPPPTPGVPAEVQVTPPPDTEIVCPVQDE